MGIIKKIKTRLLEVRYAKHAQRVEWDDDELRIVYLARCSCDGEFKFLKLYRCGKMETIDVVTVRCSRCGRHKAFSFRPFKIHIYPEEMIRENQQFVRL